MVGGAVSDFQMNPYGNLSQFGAFADRIFLAMDQRDPYKGCLLVSAPDLRDEVFSRSVIYLFEHDDTQGTFGIILNQQSEVSVHSVLPLFAPYCSKPASFFIGGPVETERVTGLLRLKPDCPVDLSLMHPVRGRTFLMDPTAHTIYRTQDIRESYRLYMGYCAWRPGQLAEEIAAGDWYVCDTLDKDFATDHHTDLYAQVVRRQPWPLSLYASRPVDPRLN